MASITENLYVGDGSTVLYSFTFPYIEEGDVKVSLNQLDTTDFTLANATTVEFNTAPGSGVSIRIYRETTVDSLYAEFYPGSAIRAQDLNGNFEQTLFVVQESQAIIENSDAATVVGIANQALTTANQAEATANAISGTANQALTESSAALTTANTAASDAITAQNTATSAQTTADTAQSTATAAQTTADNAIGVDEGLGATVGDVLIWSGSAWDPGPQTGTGGGDDIGAWASVTDSGAILSSFNTASVTAESTTGEYSVTFTTPMPISNYSVIVGGGSVAAIALNKTVNGFTVNTWGISSGSLVSAFSAFDFQVSAKS